MNVLMYHQNLSIIKGTVRLTVERKNVLNLSLKGLIIRLSMCVHFFIPPIKVPMSDKGPLESLKLLV